VLVIEPQFVGFSVVTAKNSDWANQPQGLSPRFLPLQPGASALRLILKPSSDKALVQFFFQHNKGN
jgi:hypothetical protein